MPRRRRAPVDMAFWDWSGVHSDDRKPVHEANNRMLASRGLTTLTFEDWLLHVRGQSHAPGSLRALGYSGTDDEIQQTYREFYTVVNSEGLRPIPYPDSLPTLKATKALGIPTGIVSSHPTQHLVKEAGEYGVRGYLDHIEGDAYGKAEEIVMLAERCGIGEDRVVVAFTGDMVNDIRAAKKAQDIARRRGHKLRVISVAITTGYHPPDLLKEAEPDILVHSLTEWEELFYRQLPLFN